MPTLGDRLAWAYLYYDAQTDDARLTLAIARTAALDHGATVVNHAGGGLLARRRPGGRRGRGRRRPGDDRGARPVVVNATGVWADDVRALDEGTPIPTASGPAKGIHITVPWDKVRNDIAVVVPVPEGPPLGVRGAVGRRGRHGGRARSPTSAPPTPTTTATSTTPSARPTTSPTC